MCIARLIWRLSAQMLESRTRRRADGQRFDKGEKEAEASGVTYLANGCSPAVSCPSH
jgi:hypothetical protein